MRVASGLMFCALAAPVAAEPWQCRFDIECYAQESCNSTDYDITLGPLGDRYLLSDISGERPMTEIEVLDAPDMRAFASLIQNASVQLLSIFPDRTAHLAIHAADSPPFTITYRGTCEVEP